MTNAHRCYDSSFHCVSIRDELIRYVNETHAEMMVMGRQTRGPGRNVFKIAKFDNFVAELEPVRKPEDHQSPGQAF